MSDPPPTRTDGYWLMDHIQGGKGGTKARKELSASFTAPPPGAPPSEEVVTLGRQGEAMGSRLTPHVPLGPRTDEQMEASRREAEERELALNEARRTSGPPQKYHHQK